MKKQTTILSSIVVVLIILGGLVYWSLNKNHTFYSNENINENVSNENVNIDNVNTEIDTSGWVTFENKTVGYSVKYNRDKYKFSEYRNIKFYDSFVSKENDETALIFYNKPMLDKRAGGATFASVKGYEYNDGKYYVFYGSGEYEYKKQEVEMLDKMSTDAGEIIVIDGTKFNYDGPTIGPYDDYAAVINWDGSNGYGTSIWVSDEMIGYNEFLTILKSIKKI